MSSSLNGVRLPSPESDVRSVALDVISSDIIESIEVKKTLTPDMDADTIGASVEIETTSAFDRKTRLLTVKLEGSYNDYADEVSPKGSFDFSTRLGDNVGVSGGLSYYKRTFETDNIEADDWVEAGGTIFPATVEYRDYDVERERISGTLGFDFRAGDSTELYVRGVYSQFDDQEYRRRLTFDLGDFEDDGPSTVSGNQITFDDGDQEFTVERDVKDRFESQKIRSIVAGGESDWGTWFANYSLAGRNRASARTAVSIRSRSNATSTVTGSTSASTIRTRVSRWSRSIRGQHCSTMRANTNSTTSNSSRCRTHRTRNGPRSSISAAGSPQTMANSPRRSGSRVAGATRASTRTSLSTRTMR